MNTTLLVASGLLVGWWIGAAPIEKAAVPPDDRQIQVVINEVEKACLDQQVYMIGPKRAERLAELVRKAKPRLVVECGTALGYSGLWIARELKAAGQGKLITIEVDPRRAKPAKDNFRKAGLQEYVTVTVGDARNAVQHIEGPIDFAFIDCGYSNYFACLKGMQPRLAPGAVIVADNVGIGESDMKEYLDYVHSNYQSSKEWFDIDLPWGKRDAMEISVLPKGTTFRVPFERPLSRIANSLKISVPKQLPMFRPLRVEASKGSDSYRMYIGFTFQGEEDPSLRLRVECRVVDRGSKCLAREVIVTRDPRILAREPQPLGAQLLPISSLEVTIPKDAIDEHKIGHLEFVIAKEVEK